MRRHLLLLAFLGSAAALALTACGGPEISEFGTAKAGGWEGGAIPVPDVTPGPEPQNVPRARGIDVSEFQGTVDWSAVKAAGKRFAFIRVSDGTGHLDTKFSENWPAAKSAGVIRGAYQFYRAGDDANAQAQLLLQKIGTYDRTDIPPVLDVEVTDGQTDSKIRSGIATWVSVVKQAIGREPIIYTSPGFWDGIGAGQSATTLWVAHWGVSSPTLPNSWDQYYFWQYSDAGHVSGVSGAVDVDLYNGSIDELRDYLANGR